MLGSPRGPNANWPELQEELLELIASNLSCLDVRRFRSVCTSWRAVAERVKSGPLLLLPSSSSASRGEEGRGSIIRLGVFSVKDKRTYDLKLNLEESRDILNEPERVRFVGSSHGWMVMLNSNAEAYLFNVFSRNWIPLPDKETVPELVNSSGGLCSSAILQRTFIHKAILTANPSSTDNFKVVIIHNTCRKLAFCSEFYSAWTGFSDSQGYSDIVWSEGTLYTLRDGVRIEGWGFSDDYPTRKFSVQCSFVTDLSFSSDRCTTQWYLVPSMGEILFVVRYIGEFVNGRGELLCEAELPDNDGEDYCCAYRTFNFRVYKLDLIEGTLDRVKSLNDQVVFVGGNHGISVSVRECRGFKDNSIYFTDDYWDRMYEDYCYGGHDVGVFSLEEESVCSVCDECDFVRRFEPTPFWVLPS